MTLGAVLILASFVVSIIGIINIIEPQGWMRVRKRLVGAFIVLGSMGGCVAGLSVMLPSIPSAPRTITFEQAIKQRNESDETSHSNSLTQAEFDATWNDVKVKMEQCDGRYRTAGLAMARGNEQEAIPLTSAAVEACKTGWAAFGDVPIPNSAGGIVRQSLMESVQTCRGALQLKAEGAEKTLQFMKGDKQPASAEGVKEALQSAGHATANCGFAFMQTANYAQLAIPDLPGVRAYVAAQAAEQVP